jgi:hypothetical protein
MPNYCLPVVNIGGEYFVYSTMNHRFVRMSDAYPTFEEANESLKNLKLLHKKAKSRNDRF